MGGRQSFLHGPEPQIAPDARPLPALCQPLPALVDPRNRQDLPTRHRGGTHSGPPALHRLAQGLAAFSARFYFSPSFLRLRTSNAVFLAPPMTNTERERDVPAAHETAWRALACHSPPAGVFPRCHLLHFAGSLEPAGGLFPRAAHPRSREPWSLGRGTLMAWRAWLGWRFEAKPDCTQDTVQNADQVLSGPAALGGAASSAARVLTCSPDPAWHRPSRRPSLALSSDQTPSS